MEAPLVNAISTVCFGLTVLIRNRRELEVCLVVVGRDSWPIHTPSLRPTATGLVAECIRSPA